MHCSPVMWPVRKDLFTVLPCKTELKSLVICAHELTISSKRIPVFDVRSLPCMHYLGQVGGSPDGPSQSFTVRVDSSHMAPHPLPGLLIYREASSVDKERHSSISQLFLSFILLLIVSFLHVRNGAQHPLLPELGVGSSQARTATTPWTFFFVCLFKFLQVILLAALVRFPKRMTNTWYSSHSKGKRCYSLSGMDNFANFTCVIQAAGDALHISKAIFKEKTLSNSALMRVIGSLVNWERPFNRHRFICIN